MFKKGDTVRVIKADGSLNSSKVKVGDTGVIVNSDNQKSMYVKFDCVGRDLFVASWEVEKVADSDDVGEYVSMEGMARYLYFDGKVDAIEKINSSIQELHSANTITTIEDVIDFLDCVKIQALSSFDNIIKEVSVGLTEMSLDEYIFTKINEEGSDV